MHSNDVKHEAHMALDEILDGRCGNNVQENIRLRFLSATAKYLRAIKDLEYARQNPNIGFPVSKDFKEVKVEKSPKIY